MDDLPEAARPSELSGESSNVWAGTGKVYTPPRRNWCRTEEGSPGTEILGAAFLFRGK